MRRWPTCASSSRSMSHWSPSWRARTTRSSRSRKAACMGGAGSAVLEALPPRRHRRRRCCTLGLPDEFIEHGDPAKLLSLFGLDAAGIEQSILSRFGATAGAGDGRRSTAERRARTARNPCAAPRSLWCHPCDCILAAGALGSIRCRPLNHDQPERRAAHPRHAKRARRAPPRDPARRREGRALSAARCAIGKAQLPTVAQWDLDVALPAEQKGTHMSRFVAWLDALDGAARQRRAAQRSSARCSPSCNASEGRIEARFPFFLRKRAPVSGVESLLDYQGRWVAETRGRRQTSIWAEVVVPVKSAVPVLEGDLRLRRAQPALAW